jgi:hypothetical protein
MQSHHFITYLTRHQSAGLLRWDQLKIGLRQLREGEGAVRDVAGIIGENQQTKYP